MNTDLPPTIAAFFEAHNTGQTGEFNELFTADALVSDEQHEYRGSAIKQWIDGAVAKYQPKAEPIEVTQIHDRTSVTARVSGNFPGSPIQLRYSFVLREGRIAALVIGP